MSAGQPRVVVVTGASGGVGRAVARAFGARGDAVALLARGRAGLEGAAADVRAAGGRALPLEVDTASWEQVQSAAQRVEDELGPIDVWVNVAFTSVFARFTEIEPEEYKRVTEVSYLGYVYGTRAALDHMLPRDRGAVVQVGSTLAYRGIPLQSAYCGAKHAIQGFHESLRCELLHDGSRVHTTMVQLPAVNTPQFDWVLNKLPHRAQPVPPIYQPEVIARSVLHAADHPERREYWCGESTAATLIANAVAPGLLDRYLARTGFQSQQTPAVNPAGAPQNLWDPVDAAEDHGAHGRFDARSIAHSPQAWLSRHHAVAGSLAALVAGGVAALLEGLTVALRLEDYAYLGDRRTGALVGADGSVDWLCLPRFDAPACFAALLGTEEHGRWRVAPTGTYRPAGRRYRPDSMVLETDLTGAEGTVRVTDAMPVHGPAQAVVRLVTGLQGRVSVTSALRPAFAYGSVRPLWRTHGRRLEAVAGPASVVLDGDVRHEVEDDEATATFSVEPGETVALRLAWREVGAPLPPAQDLRRAVADTDRWWRRWAGRCTYDGPYRDAVVRSLLTLKALTYDPSGGIVAAATTSLPEQLGGARNWDYRYCWVRDATFTLLALLDAGYEGEAAAWRDWLLRALAGTPEQLQIMYGVAGERHLPETELDLPGYAGSRPVRVGNAASTQYQLDVYGELMDCLHQAREQGLRSDPEIWSVQTGLLDVLEGRWQEPDNGIWEVRGPRRDFVHSKVMAWVAVDRAVEGAERLGLPGPLDRWRALRSAIAQEVCEKGYDADRGTFTQYYGSRSLDAALLQIAPVGFLPPRDPRVRGTVAAIERELLQEGFVMRYDTAGGDVDALPPGEGAFLPCTFWLADNHALAGDLDRATEVYERLLGLRNDVGLLTEEYDVAAGRLVGNLPQAFSHVPLVSTAYTLQAAGRGAARRRAGSSHPGSEQ